MYFAKSGLCSLVILLAAMGSTVAADGAAAYVKACIFLPDAPQVPVSFRFVAGGPDDQCMNVTGSDAKAVADKNGLTCVDIGRVQSKSISSGGDFCLTADSIWTLTYSADNVRNPKGSTRSQWSNPLFGDNSVKLEDQSPGTVLCGSKEFCSKTEVEWSGSRIPEIFVIFEPDRVR